MEPQYNQYFIYTSMSLDRGYQILDQSKVFKQNCLNKPVVWLLRESNTAGMLTIDFKYFQEALQVWKNTSLRFQFSADENSWTIAHPKDFYSIQQYKLMNPEMATREQKIEILLQTIESISVPNLENFVIKRCNQVLPEINEQCTNEIDSFYLVDKFTVLKVFTNMHLAINCELSKKPFKDPVIMNCTLEHQDYKFYLGRSYEKSELEWREVPKESYYPNNTLKDVINRLGSFILEKYKAMHEDKFQDVLQREYLIDPVVLPSGDSISESTWDMLLKEPKPVCPFSRMELTAKVPNNNLRVLMNEWPSHQEMLIQQCKNFRGGILC